MKGIKQILVIITSVLIISGCSDTPQELLVGKWRNELPPANRHDIFRGYHFFDDGTVSMLTPSGGLGGNYNFVGEDKVKIKLDGFLGLAGPQVYKMIFRSDDALVLQNVSIKKAMSRLRRVPQ